MVAVVISDEIYLQVPADTFPITQDDEIGISNNVITLHYEEETCACALFQDMLRQLTSHVDVIIRLNSKIISHCA